MTKAHSRRSLVRETESSLGDPSSGRDPCSPLQTPSKGATSPAGPREGVPDEAIPEPGLEG